MLTQVSLVNGTPTAGTGDVSTIDALMACIGEVSAAPTANTVLDRLKQLLTGVVLAAGSRVDTANTASDGSGTIASGNLAQDLFGGVVPTNGFAVYNPDTNEDLWISLSTTAAIGGQGSIRVAANGGGYEMPPTAKPFHKISIIAVTTGHKFTAIKW